MTDELFIKNCISSMEKDIEDWESQIEYTKIDLEKMKEKLRKLQCKIIATPHDYQELKAEVKPVPNNLQSVGLKIQHKCRFCENLSPWVDRGRFDDLVMCFELGVIDNGDIDEVTECQKFEWIDELKGLVK